MSCRDVEEVLVETTDPTRRDSELNIDHDSIFRIG